MPGKYKAVFGGPKEPIGQLLGGLSVMIEEAGDEIIVRARAKRSEIKYLITILNERLTEYAEEPSGPTRGRGR
jgi:hypothetical protein